MEGTCISSCLVCSAAVLSLHEDWKKLLKHKVVPAERLIKRESLGKSPTHLAVDSFVFPCTYMTVPCFLLAGRVRVLPPVASPSDDRYPLPAPDGKLSEQR